MDALTRRPYREQDAAKLAALMNAVEAVAGAGDHWTADDMPPIFGGLVRDPNTDSVLVFAGDGTLVAGAAVGTPPEGGFRVGTLGGVHPSWRGRGIGRDLLGWQVARAEAIHRDRAPQAPWQLNVDVALADDGALRLFRRYGLIPARYWFDMAAPTAGTPDLPVPAGLRTCTYRPEHEAAVHRAHMAAFADHWGFQYRPPADWAPLTVRAPNFLPRLSRVAFDGDLVAGYLLSYRPADRGELYIGHVGVVRPWRRRGLAAALLVQAMAAAHAAGMARASLGVDADSPTGAVGVYERVGFAVRARTVTYALALPPLTQP